jgi:hypothetical protein
LIDGLSQRWGWPVIVTGSAPERSVAAAVREHPVAGHSRGAA